ncbi:MAG: CHAT domain-containing protein [Chitinophagales bacterium]
MYKDTTTIILQLSLNQAKIILSEGKAAVAEKDSGKAIELFSKVIEVFEVHEEWEDFMEASYELATAYIYPFKLSEAMEIIEHALKIRREKCPDIKRWGYYLYSKKSRIFNLRGIFSKGIEYLVKAQEVLEGEGMSKFLLIENLTDQCDCWTMVNDLTKAYELLAIISDLLEDNKRNDLLMNFYSTQAKIEYMNSNYLLAKEMYGKSLQICMLNRCPQEAYYRFEIAGIDGLLGNREEELNAYIKIFEQYDKLYGGVYNKRIKLHLGTFYGPMGRCLGALGDYVQALHYFEKAMIFLEESGEGVDKWIVSILNDIAWVYGKQKKYDKQIEYIERALELHQNTADEAEYMFSSIIYQYMADAYMDKNDREKSLFYYEKALAADIEYRGENHDRSIGAYKDLGIYWTKNKDYSKGLEYLHIALKKVENKFGHIHEITADIYLRIAYNFHQQGKLETALEHYQLALTADLPNYQETNFYHFPDVGECLFLSADLFLEILSGKARALFDHALFLEKKDFPKAIKSLKGSLNTCQLAADYLQQLHKTLKAEDSKLIYGERMTPIYQQAIKVVLLLSDSLGEESILEQAFTFHELAKALLLRSSMKESEAKMRASIEPQLLEQERNLRNQIEVYLQKIQKEEAKGAEKDENQLKEWKRNHFNELLKHQTLIEQFEQDYPEYYELKYNLQTVSVTNLQKDLDENTVVISYFIGPEKGYIFAVTYDEYEVIPFDLPKDFDQQIQDYLNSIQAQNITDFIPQSHALYFLLIEPISYLVFDPFAGKPKNVVILPSASLNYLPFETLIREIPHTAQAAFHQLDYLLQHCQIQYHYSATLYHQSLQKNAQETSLLSPTEKSESIDFLGFAPIYTSDKAATQEALRGLAEDYSRWATRSDALRDGTLAPLPFSEKEVENIEGLFTQKGLKGQSQLYDTATKDHFKSLAANAKYLHIAAHGLTNDEYPKLSGIVFHPDEKATEIHDSVLSMGEMYQLQLQADLVVLSSCESGIGKLAKGEGMMAINRGFLYAGAKNVIYTLFKVLDKPSSELCEALFAEILEGKTYTEALRLAKLRLIQRADVDPKSWSGFVLLGA